MEVLLQATEQVLEEHGREGVTPLRIASRAGVSIGSLYQCFRHKDALVEAALERRKHRAAQQAAPPPPPSAPSPSSSPAPPPPPAPPLSAPPSSGADTLEEDVGAIVGQLVSSFARALPSMASMSKADRSAVQRAEFKRMAEASRELMANHHVPGADQAAHVMTLSCSKVVKDAMSHATESFTDGRLEQALCRLCLDFVRSEQKS